MHGFSFQLVFVVLKGFLKMNVLALKTFPSPNPVVRRGWSRDWTKSAEKERGVKAYGSANSATKKIQSRASSDEEPGRDQSTQIP